MGKSILTQLGRITISDDVIASVAGMAATACYGLVGMASRTLTDGIAELLGYDNLARGVEVDARDDGLRINL